MTPYERAVLRWLFEAVLDILLWTHHSRPELLSKGMRLRDEWTKEMARKGGDA